MKKLLYTLLVVGTFIGIQSCKKPTEGVELSVSEPIQDYRIVFQVYDAKTGDQLGADDVNYSINVEVTGQDKDWVVDFQNKTSYKCKGGFLTLALKDGANPSASNPIKFNVVFSKNGLITTAKSVTVTEKGYIFERVYMVNLTNLPEGVATVKSTNLSANGQGVTQSQLVLSTPNVQTTGEATKATVSIPQGITLMDENMQPVTGTITSQMTYFNPSDESSLNSFPGGFTAETNVGGVTFKTAGFVALDITGSGGKKVRNFSSPITMTMEIPAGTKDDQGNLVTAGSTIPIWSFETSTGEWTYEFEAPVTLNSTTSKLECIYTMSHLSYWNMDWDYGDCGDKTLTINSEATSAMTRYAKIYIDGSYHKSKDISVQNGSQLPLLYYPTNADVKLKIYKQDNSTLLQEITLSTGCAAQTIDISPDLFPLLKINLFYRPCGASYTIPMSGPFYFRKPGETNWKYAGNMVNGVLDAYCFQLNVDYEIAWFGLGNLIKSPGTFKAKKSEETTEFTDCE